MLLNHLFLLFVGLVGLWFGSELLTNSAQKIARKIGLSETFIGLTVLAFGTGFPEIIIGINGALDKLAGHDTTGLVIGNVIGSNMIQISLVLGLSGLLKIFKMKKEVVIKNGIVLVASTLCLFLLALDGTLSRADGLILIMFYLVYFFSLQRKTKISIVKGKFRSLKARSFLPVIKIIVGLLILSQASEWVIDHGTEISDALGLSQMIVGAFLIALGTSLPELAVSINAIVKGSEGLSIGNLIGSNIINVAVTLGLSSVISGWEIQRSVANFDLAYLLFTSVIVVLFLLTKETLERKESFLILCLYAVYLSLKVLGF